MKTRRILAASTAALLAFGTTAAYVASAATTTYSAVSLAYPADYAGTQDKAIGALATPTVSGSDVTINFATKTRAEIAAMPKDSAVNSPLYLTVTTNIANSVDAGDDGFTFAAGSDYDFDDSANKDWNFDDSKIKLWLPATTTGDKLTIKYKVGSGEVETLTINYKYKTPPTPMDKAVLDTEGDWEDFDAVNGGISAKIAYKMSEAALEKNDGWILKVTNKNSKLTTYTDIRGKDGIFEGISSTTAKSVIKEYDEEGKLAVLDFSVGEPDDEDWVDIGSTKLPAAISLRVSNLSFKPKHVYHFTNKQLVELDARQIKITEDENTSYGIEFTTKSFSPYVFSENAIKGAVAADDKANPETSGNTSNAASTATSNGSSTTNPDTGIALAIAPVVLAAGAVAVVALKKKH